MGVSGFFVSGRSEPFSYLPCSVVAHIWQDTAKGSNVGQKARLCRSWPWLWWRHWNYLVHAKACWRRLGTCDSLGRRPASRATGLMSESQELWRGNFPKIQRWQLLFILLFSEAAQGTVLSPTQIWATCFRNRPLCKTHPSSTLTANFKSDPLPCAELDKDRKWVHWTLLWSCCWKVHVPYSVQSMVYCMQSWWFARWSWYILINVIVKDLIYTAIWNW